ncbi:hypothetical protein ADIMK_0875 [Marinobacterium lacunae]|uniref:Uncharacterized protein n=1 Tax=Marinobacterium lacunae TaxID=1232683 RepID=A0A081G318_9GAMM|nr:hypothetical protein ADIMK_0875 [Marinobacterium lacunae]
MKGAIFAQKTLSFKSNCPDLSQIHAYTAKFSAGLRYPIMLSASKAAKMADSNDAYGATRAP